MPAYDYQCPECGRKETLYCSALSEEKVKWDGGGIVCAKCLQPLKRKFGFNLGPVFPEHYNGAIGQHVTSNTQFEDGLKRASEEMEARTGIPSNFQPIDQTELKRMSLEKHGDAGLKEQHDAAVRRGEKDPVGKTVL